MKEDSCFSVFSRWKGTVEPGFSVNFLGAKTSLEYWTGLKQETGNVESNYPGLDEEYFEWIDLLEAVTESESQFRMIELGAGFGRWSVNGALAATQLGKNYDISAVEPEPQHFRWLLENIRNNGLDSNKIHTINRAIANKSGKALFLGGNPQQSYGQGILSPHYRPSVRDLLTRKVELIRVKTISMQDLLVDADTLDLLDVDIQGKEFEVLRSARDQLQSKVRRIHVGTHGRQIEEDLRSMFLSLGWHPRYDYPCQSSTETIFGRVSFVDGVQSWQNPTWK